MRALVGHHVLSGWGMGGAPQTAGAWNGSASRSAHDEPDGSLPATSAYSRIATSISRAVILSGFLRRETAPGERIDGPSLRGHRSAMAEYSPRGSSMRPSSPCVLLMGERSFLLSPERSVLGVGTIVPAVTDSLPLVTGPTVVGLSGSSRRSMTIAWRSRRTGSATRWIQPVASSSANPRRTQRGVQPTLDASSALPGKHEESSRARCSSRDQQTQGYER